MKQFRPIALCNSVYKGLSKILANKIKPLIGDLISPSQVNFIPKRNIQDNIIIVQELIHSMHRMKGKKSFFSIKIDLEKAYDKLNWEFIKSVLEDLKLPGDLVAAIMGCVTSPFIEVLWNGARTQGFYSKRGIRQGDPISPYLFVLCMEKLTHLIMDEVGRKNWHPIKAGRSGPLISHLMFMDDIILLAEASLSQLDCITSCLEKFSRMSGQCVSMEKSCIYFSKNTSQETVDSISSVSGFKIVKNIGCYLGALMRHGRIRRDHYADVISIVYLGRYRCKKKAYYVAWDQLCRPRECGGLGIINLRLQNEAFGQKISRQLINDQNSLWTKVLLGKYGRKQDPNRSLIVRKSDSSLWKNICLARDKLAQHLIWEVGNGKSVLFWTDYWGGWKNNMYDPSLVKPPSSDLELKVCDLVDQETGGWNWSYLENRLDEANFGKLQTTLPPDPSGPDDKLSWIRNNPVVHDELFSWPSDPICRILSYLVEMKESSNGYPFTSKIDSHISFGGLGQQVEKDTIKNFVDGAVNLNSKTGTCGGFICTSNGDWLSGFSLNIGSCSPLEAELWGIWQGLKLAVDLNLRKVWLGSDSKEALLCVESPLSDGFLFVTRKISSIIQFFDHFHMEFVPREYNICADSLAMIGFNCRGGELKLFSSPPASILPLWSDLCKYLLMEHVSFNMHQLSI
ncbi:uncharacterized protein LOC133309118 [Gastrolobium bilobum]|uniref:uncharacterized protein LOC133309118 n=1 Tax=Gastrolobium bilobum TaxID=150636 RepID=UPI002AB08E7F|nr:uncharacterized protein LOC133309118 [Gastrolobium bilobum]